MKNNLLFSRTVQENLYEVLVQKKFPKNFIDFRHNDIIIIRVHVNT